MAHMAVTYKLKVMHYARACCHLHIPLLAHRHMTTKELEHQVAGHKGVQTDDSGELVYKVGAGG